MSMKRFKNALLSKKPTYLSGCRHINDAVEIILVGQERGDDPITVQDNAETEALNDAIGDPQHKDRIGILIVQLSGRQHDGNHDEHFIKGEGTMTGRMGGTHRDESSFFIYYEQSFCFK
jgi:hypothetical protein